MKILSSGQIRKADEHTIKYEPISSVYLMERASEKFTNAFIEYYSSERPVAVIAGKGNNGGDGLAISRLLAERGYELSVYSFGSEKEGSSDFIENYRRLAGKIIIDSPEAFNPSEHSPDSIIIDALFGTGLTRSVEGKYAEIIKVMNSSGMEIVSVDVPSGLYCDDLNDPDDIIVESSRTLTFQLPKLSFMLPENQNYINDWETLNINLNPEFISECDTTYHYTQKQDLLQFYRKRKKFEHKGSFGRCLLIGGSYGKIGAMVLTSRACLKSGAGLITAHIPKCGYEIIQSSVPEVMCSTSTDFSVVDNLPEELNQYNVIGVGPGLGNYEQTTKVIKELFRKYSRPMVLDADALNIVAQNNLLNFIPSGSIITPHVGEFDRLFWKKQKLTG